MLQKQLKLLIEKTPVALLPIERKYAEEQGLLEAGTDVLPAIFQPSVVERCNKETEEPVAGTDAAFYTQPISYLKEHEEEFVYVEANRLDVVGIDAVAVEFDRLYGGYTALFGFQMQKKYGDAIKSYLDKNLQQAAVPYSISFSGQDGLWEMNINVGAMPGFDDTQSFEQVMSAFYEFMFHLLESIEQQ